MENKGLLIVLSGPSGVGKGTILKKFVNDPSLILAEIEVQGAQQVMAKAKDALTIFIVPPSMEELEKRIRGRGTESNDVIESRLAKAKGELALKDKYEYVVCNDDVDRAATEITNIIKEHMTK